MPELPEVETIKRGLVLKIKGKIISGVRVLWKGVLNVSAKKFAALVKNTKVLDISRRAKILIITLSGDYLILIHLKMTGQLLYAPKISGEGLEDVLTDSSYKHARLILFFSDSSALVFNDLRKFGYIKIVSRKKIQDVINSEKFGPEPLERGFIFEKFEEMLKKYPKRRIKQFLMDQEIIAGIGNIYADEICFYAKIMPTRTVSGLTIKEARLIFEGIKKILARAIALKGSSVENYVDISGQKGDYIKELKVYDREGEKCFLCPGKVTRIKFAGRSAHFCPMCQK